MTPQLITPLIQLPLVDPQLLGQLLGTAALHPLHRSALLFPTPTSISLPTLHSMLHGEFSSCLILGGHSRVEMVMGIISGKWKPAIIYALVTNGTLRFNDLRRLMPKVSQRMLTQQLRDLERHGIVKRVLHPQVPPRVEYSMTRLGRSLHPIFKSVCQWADKNFA